ncbi:MAG: NADH-quinone oxidoreductase subunit M [Candidatus Methanomethylophilaceae archaeon]|jgi:NADH-quinone oxidoreductase subunit M|nr:NADH-quinone oxidoreductase subunit M [Thermoplasmata archaeon]MBQ3685456.1 NADH-quinone oxidoreductase subunit M [Candidatus Methanomethylophilaceae archaeon]
MEFSILALLLIIPLIGAIATLCCGGERQKAAKYVAGAFSGVTLALALYIMFLCDFGDLDMTISWIETEVLTINFALHVDGLSILMVFLTALLSLLVIVFSAAEKDRPQYFHALVLAMEVGLMGVYLASDYFLFYVMWELTLIPMYFMISWYGGPRRHYAAIKFFIYTHVASLVMLIGIFAMGFEALSMTGTMDFSFAFINTVMPFADESFQILVFALLFFGFMVKMPSVPFHTWLPDAHVEAPTGGSVLLAGVMLKMGSYGIIRVCLEALPEGAEYWQWVIIAIGLLSMVYGAYACIAQSDLKKMVAFSSISHMGMVMLGIGCLSEAGVMFAIFQMFAHGLITGVLFMVAGMAGHNFGTREIPLLGGMAGKVPIYATFMMIGWMASLGLPGLVGFWGEFPLVFAFYDFIQSEGMLWLIVFCLLNLMLTAGYYLWSMQRVLFGVETTKIDMAHVHDVSKTEGIAMAVLVGLIALFGVWPALALDYIGDYTSLLMGVF